MQTVYLAAAKRSAIGTFGGALKGISPSSLGTTVSKAVIASVDLDPAALEFAIFGQVIITDSKDPYLSRVIALDAGLPISTPAVSLNRLCGSGMQAIIQGANLIQLGEVDMVLAGGAEVMSRAPHSTQDMRWGQKMGQLHMRDMLEETLKDPFQGMLMGVTAENIAKKYGIGRDAQDAFALQSHQRAERAIQEGRFVSQIAPVEVVSRRQTRSFDTDEHVRLNAQIEDFQKLRAVFEKDGTVTAGNASGINDGACAVVLASEQALKTHGLTPMARFVCSGHGGVEPTLMGTGPIPATHQAMARSGLSVKDFDSIESNEAFAVQALSVSQELGFDPAKVNPNGSGISLGHPVGATGAINVTKLVYELQRSGGRYGLATMCIGGGQGVSSIWENLA